MYFDKFKTEVEIKERFRLLAKRFHPDLGGDKIIMQEINFEYEQALFRLKNVCTQKSTEFRPPTYHEFNDPEDKIEKVLKWADKNPNFDTTFIESLAEQLSNGKDLTDAQENALNNIIKRFRI